MADFLFVGNKIYPYIYGNKSVSPEIRYKNFFFSIMKKRSILKILIFTFFMGNAMFYFYITNMLQRGNSTCGYKKMAGKHTNSSCYFCICTWIYVLQRKGPNKPHFNFFFCLTLYFWSTFLKVNTPSCGWMSKNCLVKCLELILYLCSEFISTHINRKVRMLKEQIKRQE